ncbi:MAG: DUF5615 family PIN-like protein [bacterium]|nr:DUF5615 family PIN-like protein [bacterium]
MKFVADENIETAIIIFLREKGYDVINIKESYRGVTDERVLKVANQENRILITNDKDFGELIFFQKRISSGILLIRSFVETSSAKVKLVKNVIEQIGERLKENFVVVSESGYRIRPLKTKEV